MEREQLTDLQHKTIIYDGETSTIYRLDDGRIAKVRKRTVFGSCMLLGINYEDKILDTRARQVGGIVYPLTAIYDKIRCVGYTMEEVHDPSLNQVTERATLEDIVNLRKYFEIYEKLEKLIFRANKQDIIVPDLCTCDNIIITPNGEIKLIDYDEMQIGPNDKALTLSTSLGDPAKYLSSKKFSTDFFHFTKELDKTSLTILMFLWIFNVDLKKVGQMNPYTGKPLTLKEIFECLGIEDLEFMRKVEANLSSYKRGEYLVKDLYRIVNNYRMVILGTPNPSEGYLKKLIRK